MLGGRQPKSRFASTLCRWCSPHYTSFSARTQTRNASSGLYVAGLQVPRSGSTSSGQRSSLAVPLPGGGSVGSSRPPTNNGSTVYVSSHFSLHETEVQDYLKNRKLVFSDKGDKMAVKYCPTCPPHKNASSNLFKLYVWKETGTFFCHRCSNKGSWYDLKSMYGAKEFDMVSALGGPAQPANGSSLPKPNAQEWEQAKADLLNNKHGALDTLVRERGIKKEIFEKYGVGVAEKPFANDTKKDEFDEHVCVIFPWTHLEESGAVADRIKIRSMERKSLQRIAPAGGSWGLFGFHTVPASAEEIVLTEGEYDAMAVHQATGLPAVSLPNGANSLPPALLPSLERFKKIYLWMDDDIAGQEGAEKFAQKLGYPRVHIVQSNMPDTPSTQRIKDANDALKAGASLKKLIRRSGPIPHQKIATFTDLRSDVLREIREGNALNGLQYMTLPSLNGLLKGFRSGELTILTGPTGCGKTTLLSQLSLDLAQQGTNTLWGSFEIKTTRLAKIMMSQYCGKSLENCVDDFDYYADKFESLNMFFLRYFGATSVDQVLDAMDYACYVHDVKHVVLDNLQFMLGTTFGPSKFDQQDQAIEKLRAFATQKNIHVTLVIHPRKEADDVEIGVSSVFGSAKATQEADNVLVFQRSEDDNMRILKVKKNRYAGHLGSVECRFDHDARIYKEDAAEETLGIFNAHKLHDGDDDTPVHKESSSGIPDHIPSVSVPTSPEDFVPSYIDQNPINLEQSFEAPEDSLYAYRRPSDTYDETVDDTFAEEAVRSKMYSGSSGAPIQSRSSGTKMYAGGGGSPSTRSYYHSEPPTASAAQKKYSFPGIITG